MIYKKPISIILGFIFLLICVLCLILLFGFVIPLYREYSANQVVIAKQLEDLRILLCGEEIQLGMTKEQVFSILEQKGQMSISESGTNQPNSSLGIVYFDPILNEKYGRFILIFRDYIYVRSLLPTGFEDYEIICSIDY